MPAANCSQVQLGRAEFQHSKENIGLRLGLASTFSSLQTVQKGRPREGVDAAFLKNETWMFAGSSFILNLRISVDYAIAPSSNALTELKYQISEVLVAAEFWAQLKLSPSILGTSNSCEHNIFEIRLCLDRYPNEVQLGSLQLDRFCRQDDESPRFFKDICQLRTVDLKLRYFNQLSDKICIPRKRPNPPSITGFISDFKLSAMIDLLDLGIRTAIHSEPTKLRAGVRMLESNIDVYLAEIAPSVFVPGLSVAIHDRISLVSSIENSLFKYISTSDRLSDLNDGPDHIKNVECIRRDKRQSRTQENLSGTRVQLQQNIWYTLLASLRDTQPARRLKPLKRMRAGIYDREGANAADILMDGSNILSSQDENLILEAHPHEGVNGEADIDDKDNIEDGEETQLLLDLYHLSIETEVSSPDSILLQEYDQVEAQDDDEDRDQILPIPTFSTGITDKGSEIGMSGSELANVPSSEFCPILDLSHTEISFPELLFDDDDDDDDDGYAAEDTKEFDNADGEDFEELILASMSDDAPEYSELQCPAAKRQRTSKWESPFLFETAIFGSDDDGEEEQHQDLIEM